MKSLRKLILFVSMFVSMQATAQLNPIGSWTDHLPYRFGTSITHGNGVIYCGTKTGLFSYDYNDNSISKYSKVNILNDVGIEKIKYSKLTQSLIVVYKSLNIDILSKNGVINIPFIKTSSEEGTINEIKLEENLAYLSFSFGIVVLDLIKLEIKDTYKFGPNGGSINVNSTEQIGQTLYAGTDKGFYKASTSQNLLDFNNWILQPFKQNSKIEKTAELNNKLVITSQTDSNSLFIENSGGYSPISGFENKKILSIVSLENNTLQVLTDKSYSILDQTLQLIKNVEMDNSLAIDGLSVNNKIYTVTLFDPLAVSNLDDGNLILFVKPNGPADKTLFDMDIENGQLWAVNGGHSFSYSNSYRNLNIYNYVNGFWKSYGPYTLSSLNGLFDALSVTINPSNDQVFFGMWGNGMLHYKGGENFTSYDTSNSSLKIREALASSQWIGTGESALDEFGNLWVTNTNNVNSVSVRKTNGKWTSFNFSNLISIDETTIYDIIITDEGYKWFTLPKENSIIVFDDNGTIDNKNDDRSILLSPAVGSGNIPGNRGIKIEKDNNGLVWIGTTDGVAVHFNPSQVFEAGNKDFDRIIFNDGTNNEILLKNVAITDIAIDGANQKWIGTENSGVLLLSEDGKETIASFDDSNSPLFSNSITAISIDQKSGEVFFATTDGLISYRGSIAEGSENYSGVTIFPNPVRPSYSGVIVISGLIDNSTVKITDINGTLINEFKSEGGQVIWNGNNFEGRRASSGVYLVFSSAEVETGDLKTHVAKILFID